MIVFTTKDRISKRRRELYAGSSVSSINARSTDERTVVLPKVPPCRHCGAYKFYKESEFFCCSKGDITLAESVFCTTGLYSLAHHYNRYTSEEFSEHDSDIQQPFYFYFYWNIM
ncbi:hypothetical protein LIER_43289 [Lithospermum erythrorhizon]|uniref:Uncharacterized protein n=1 Tax=Lithospermum erythrorhizon TaxID=34254 RepID=A0AAV3PUC2_LITER